MKLGKWFASRGLEFVHKRAFALLNRYGVTPTKAQDRITTCVDTLARYGCAPTFPTPGSIVVRYPQFIRRLQDASAEIAVHSYDHIDLRAYPTGEASQQMTRAVQAFRRYGIEVHGFRCPYLSYTDELTEALPKGLFKYSSNCAIRWDTVPLADSDSAGTVFDTINRFYHPMNARDSVCVPWMRTNMVEIPVCVPDDLQLHDGLQLDPEGIAGVWEQMLNQTHARGELFTLLFHPELAARCMQPLEAILQEAKRFQPVVWIARLRDISDWWWEKSKFRAEISNTPERLRIAFICSPRATILTRGLNKGGGEEAWIGGYYRLETTTLEVPAEPRPFVGIPADAPRQVISFLQEQGYILDTGDTATRCGIYLDPIILAELNSQVELIDYIEATASPLVRFWRWPAGAQSVLSVTGDLDALTLLDYASRLFVR